MNKKLVIEKFGRLISIQSVSTDSKRHEEILKAVEFIRKELINLGCQVNLYKKDNCPPLIIGKKVISNGLKTIGVYAHYDVQPEDPISGWKTPPFKLTVKNKKIFGRGTADDKGHLIEILAAVKNLNDKNKLTNNLVFVFEGEEEVGSENFEELIKNDRSLADVDVYYVVDMGVKDRKTPQIFYGLRGVVGFELKIRTSRSDLHSGVYGNISLNPAQILAELMAKMVDGETHQIKIPGFYDDIVKVSDEEKELLKKANKVLSSKIDPALDINGMISGYTGEGSKTIIPAVAEVKFSVRLVPNQDSVKIEKLVEEFVKKNLPKIVDYEFITNESGSNPFYTDFKNKYAQKTAKILKEVFKGETLFNRSGGSVAAAEILKRVFKKPVILIGFTLPDNNLHAPNENFDEETFWKGIVAIEKIFAQ